MTVYGSLADLAETPGSTTAAIPPIPDPGRRPIDNAEVLSIRNDFPALTRT